MRKILLFVKREVVLSVATVLAVISAFIIPPDGKYLEYVDLRTLSLLFCLMTVMAGFQRLGVFKWVAKKMLRRVGTGSIRLILVLIFLCFFFGMLITNDVALITFVPFTFTVLELLGEEARNKLIIPVVVLETIGANLGSMLTPVGNPQNLYLYEKSHLSLGGFLGLMLFYTLLAGIMLALWGILVGKRHGCSAALERDSLLSEEDTHEKRQGMLIVGYGILFLLAFTTVARLVPYPVTLIITLILVLIFDGKTLLHVDYCLLLTFIAFFVFIGNMGRIPAFSQYLAQIIGGREVLVAVLASQVISNVPAAILLSSFTDNLKPLIIGVNLGGLGTLIASMASLISYKYVAKLMPEKKGRYFLYFTVANMVFLIVLLAGHFGLTMFLQR